MSDEDTRELEPMRPAISSCLEQQDRNGAELWLGVAQSALSGAPLDAVLLLCSHCFDQF
jgi:hypothetical protein